MTNTVENAEKRKYLPIAILQIHSIQITVARK